MLRQSLLFSLAGLSLLFTSSVVVANDAQQLLKDSCVQCHQADVYQRADRKITDLAALTTQVNNCNTNVQADWFPEDVDAVVAYLNDNYYKFK